MPNWLEPDELLAFAQAEETESRASQAKAALLALVPSRKLTDYQEKEDPEVQAILDFFEPEIRDAVALMSPDELRQYAQLNEEQCQAAKIQVDLIRIASKRMQR